MKTRHGFSLTVFLTAGLALTALTALGQPVPAKPNLSVNGYYSRQHPEWPAFPVKPAGLAESVVAGKHYVNDLAVAYPVVAKPPIQPPKAAPEPMAPRINVNYLKGNPSAIAHLREGLQVRYHYGAASFVKYSWWDATMSRLSALEGPAAVAATVEPTAEEAVLFSK